MLTPEKTDSIYLRPTYLHKIDGNKIKTLDDVIKILGLMNICLDDKAVKGLEHLIADNND
ncbi:hypothetical protein P9Z94_23070 [Bacillus thuringiensis]|uniref:hypothetical protein n=1 Tax=Bacillus TaxID=1386 RepID=UPI0002D219A4|nr:MULTISPECIES: hypothetical protein [Bacillus]MCQ6334232.1 hypothetical protein [Bacillus cereus]MDO6634181.1 hypothetical protein [Bacillus thuringiensis]MDO6663404.1 hypothetical protein [Bacillus thuringiensis]MDO6704351.1 hypothetical protein [Bacillus thuringiensis]MEC3158939.1 hypothetical protein [Bacillus thuringiensis]